MRKNLDYHFLLSKIKEKLSFIARNEYIINTKDLSSYFLDIDESNCEFKKIIVEMKPLYNANKYKSKNFSFLPPIKINNFNFYKNKKYGSQGNIGDCYLISSIISMINFPLIFNVFFLIH